MSKQSKLFVLDTNVPMHDHTCIFQFADNDLFIPMQVLEELDDHKKGQDEKNYNVRRVLEAFDTLRAGSQGNIADGIDLPTVGSSPAGKLFFQTQSYNGWWSRLTDFYKVSQLLNETKPDNKILKVVLGLKRKAPDRKIVLVSKDRSMRVKASILGIATEDYTTDNLIEDKSLLASAGVHRLEASALQDIIVPPVEGEETLTTITWPFDTKLFSNDFVVVGSNGNTPKHYRVVRRHHDSYALRRTCTYRNIKQHSVYGIVARNVEQGCALDLLMDPDVDLVVLSGPAGTGKTLLALAAGMQQCCEDHRYEKIIFTRAPVPLGEDIGFLPGTEVEKMHPWLAALKDNMRVLVNNPREYGKPTLKSNHGQDWGDKATQDFLGKYVEIQNIGFMRGGSLQNRFLILDEAQNLAPKTVKGLVTRAGPGTKVVLMGNNAQIDSPYINEGSSGLTYALAKYRGWEHGGVISLPTGERSRLSNFANMH